MTMPTDGTIVAHAGVPTNSPNPRYAARAGYSWYDEVPPEVTITVSVLELSTALQEVAMKLHAAYRTADATQSHILDALEILDELQARI